MADSPMTDLAVRLREWAQAPMYALIKPQLIEAAAEIERLRAVLAQSRRSHVSCEDCWYSCPKSEDGCCDERQGKECNCGADAHNARIDAALSGEHSAVEPSPGPTR